MTAIADSPTRSPVGLLTTLELEITGGCQLKCTHCLSNSSPQSTHGTMTADDWRTLITDAAALDIPQVQLIGGEPTLNPAWTDLVSLALSLGRKVEVYSNLFHIRPHWWSLLSREGVTLATSWYSDDPDEHDAITTRTGSYLRTRANIQEALRRGIPLRAGIVHINEGQRVTEARAELLSLGVTQINTDRVRAVGRAATEETPDVAELCGRCGHGRAAVLPDGSLALCVLSRFMPCGNVKDKRLADILGSPEWWAAVERIPARPHMGCTPDDSSDCDPANTTACDPAY
ncbi:radical SAM/SPASM domain-containing protein [Streptomyces sp. ISL-100]|uniref:radical SAM/SPASM domain-containing protein n=1 Tax=Streptomyces sp. ISL-100 TaxID=2819173 RepID=UPI0027E47C64|nr:radical SAM/SPASM domain-containing protein [Streptomyces sp. ISL-100]